MLKTKPVIELFQRGQAAVARRIRRDRRKASEELHPVFDHLLNRFYDPDLTLDAMIRDGVVDRRARDLFHQEMGVTLKPYLLDLKKRLACWLLDNTRFQVKHVSHLLGFSRPANFTRDFSNWTGQNPADYRADRRRREGTLQIEKLAAARERIAARLGIDLPPTPEQQLSVLTEDRLFVHLRDAHAEQAAHLLWDVLRDETHARQLQLVREEILFDGPELFELLSRQSREAGRRDRRRGVELAELALATVEGSAALLGRRYDDLLALALARLGNAYRLAADLDRADDAFRRLDAVWGEGKKDPRVEVEICSFRASLRLFERCLDEALELLSRTLAIGKDLDAVDWQLNALLQRIALHGYRDRIPDMVCDLDEARGLLETQAEPDRCHLLGVYQELTFAHLEMGNSGKARRHLSQAKVLCEELDHTMARCQLQWLEGQLARLDGDDAAAERLYRQAYAGFLALGDRVTAALAAADLAILCHLQGRFQEVMALTVADVIPVLAEARLRQKALAASELLQEAAKSEVISLAVLSKAREALSQMQRDPCRECSGGANGQGLSPLQVGSSTNR